MVLSALIRNGIASCALPALHRIRNARQADLVIANHALVMAQAVWGGLDDDYVPTRYVFDEGHHIFDAADSAFSVELSGAAMAELRRWLLGAEGTRSRARGLQRRLEDIMASDEGMVPKLEAALIAAKALPAPMFSTRLDPGLVADTNPAEAFLRALRAQARARAAEPELRNGMPFEVDLHPIDADILPAAELLSRALDRLRRVQIEDTTTSDIIRRYDWSRAYFLSDERGRNWESASSSVCRRWRPTHGLSIPHHCRRRARCLN